MSQNRNTAANPFTVSKQRRKRDSNPRTSFPVNGFQDRRIKPLSHSSVFLWYPIPSFRNVVRGVCALNAVAREVAGIERKKSGCRRVVVEARQVSATRGERRFHPIAKTAAVSGEVDVVVAKL